MLYVLILYVSNWTYSLKSTTNDRFLRSFFMAILFALRVFVRNLLTGTRRRNILFIYSFWCLTWALNQGVTSDKPTYYLLNYSNMDWLNLFYIITHLVLISKIGWAFTKQTQCMFKSFDALRTQVPTVVSCL